MNKNNDILNQLKLNKTSENFTDKVMKDIYALDLAKEKALKNALQQNSLLSVSDDFSKNVMFNIQQKQGVFKPIEIFSIMQKLIIALCAFLVVVFSFFTNSNSSFQTFKLTDYFSLNISFIPDSPLMSISFICITLLLLIDFSLKKVKHN